MNDPLLMVRFDVLSSLVIIAFSKAVTMSYTKAGNVCAVNGCKSYAWQPDALSFFRFPKERERCAQWIIKCKRYDLVDVLEKCGPEKLYASYRICAKHFQSTDFSNPNLTSQGLKKYVMPSLHLPDKNSALSRLRKKPKKPKMEKSLGINAECQADNEICEDQDIMETDNHTMNIKVEIKEEPSCLDEVFPEVHSETVFVAASNCAHYNQVHSKVEIKEEPHDIVLPSNADDVKDPMMCVEGPIDDIAVPGSPRSHSEALSSDSSNNSNPRNTQEDNTKPFNCDICEKSFKLMSILRKHKLIHEGIKPYKCKICEKSFQRTSNLNQHLLNHEDTRPYKCELCDRSFKHKSHLTRHSFFHEDKRPFTCQECGKSFKQLIHLRGHKAVHEDTKPHVCSICDKSFKKKCVLKDHMSMHEGKAPYKCDVCGKIFQRSTNLKTHLLIHEDTRPYSCNLCARSFKQLSHLKRHAFFHEATKPHQCQHCDKSFVHLSGLKAHVSLVHENYRQFKCDICERSYKQASYLSRHKLIHGNIRPFGCAECGKSFKQKSHLKDHQNSVHEHKKTK